MMLDVQWAFWLVVLVAAAVALAALARRWGVGEPFVLTVAGVAASFVPHVPAFDVDPELVLLGLLPPLLYSAAIRTSLIDFRPKKLSITLLSVGLVLVTALAAGVVVYWLLPVPFSAAVAIGAVVAPPDAVAATAVARRVGMPRPIVTLLEGESLFNDATALVILRTAIAATAGTVTVWEAGADLVLAAGGGALFGVVAAGALTMLRRRIADPVLDTSVSFLAPWLAYLPAESVHTSGVIAVVTCGLILGFGAPRWQSAASRIAEQTNWRTIQFILESVVFLLIGLQVRHIVEAAWRSGLSHGTLLLACAAVLATIVLVRPLWVFPSTYLSWWLEGRRYHKPKPRWTAPAVVSWAGMRGVVTLAAALLLPQDTPQRATLILLAVVAVAGTLLLQGISLPWLVRTLRLRGPSRADDLLQEANLLQQASTAGLAALDANVAADTPPDVVAALRDRVVYRARTAWERVARVDSERVTPSGEYRRLRLAMLAAERDTVLHVRHSGGVDHEVMQHVMAALDLEESTIDRIREVDEADEPPTGPARNPCEHLRAAPLGADLDPAQVCAECVAEGLPWVHLRACLACGNVACCESSAGNHATKHFNGTGHPVIRSAEPGEVWRWCYVDERLG
ncbi:MAG: Na+/H+ antiporter [Mycobacteriaceae bacterium]|nr:Na+/H+ antiporter [Mycobacteriaceae bacterium]